MLELDSPGSMPSTPSLKKKSKMVRTSLLRPKPEDESLKNSPALRSAPKTSPIKKNFQNFLDGTISPSEFMRIQNFPQTHSMHNVQYSYLPNSNQASLKRLTSFKDLIKLDDRGQKSFHRTKQREMTQRQRFYDLALQFQQGEGKTKQTKSEKALQRWKKLANVIKTNIALRRKIIEERKQQMKLLGSLENEIHKQHELNPQNLRRVNLRTVTLWKEKAIRATSQQRISPKHYHFLLSRQFRENSDEYILINNNLLGQDVQQARGNEFLQDKLLFIYLNKKPLFERYQEQLEVRKSRVMKQGLVSPSSSLHLKQSKMSVTSSSQGSLTKLLNPMGKAMKVNELQQKLLSQVNDLEVIESDPNSPLKMLLTPPKCNHPRKAANKAGIIKHNRLSSQANAISGETVDEDQDNLSNASITEALLVKLYQGSNDLQKRLQSNKNQTVQRKIRDFLKLQELKVQTIQANHHKLKPSHKHQIKP